MLRKLSDFGFGVIYSGKLKVRKWIGIVRHTSEREAWEKRLMRTGHTYRQDVLLRLQRKIMGSKLPGIDELSIPDRTIPLLQKGQHVRFYALDRECELEGVVTLTEVDPTGQFFVVHAEGEGGNCAYLCRDCGDQVIGDTEF